MAFAENFKSQGKNVCAVAIFHDGIAGAHRTNRFEKHYVQIL